jgi:tryptophanyl-tRNA synthetase
MQPTRVLTGITTSGTPHLGNYAGAIRPAIAASHRGQVESFYFLADYHSLVKVTDPVRVQRSTLEIAAAWLAAGLDPNQVWFYRQSDIPEIPELTWLLTCVASKGLLNRAHAYKAANDRNNAEGLDPDAGVNAGLYMYPVLMAADILLFKAHQVPVGRDQVQHIEMARDFAARFNHIYGEHFVLPEAVIDDAVATLPGLDGRKMSKSYDNTIPLFAPAKELRSLIMGIVTDSKAPGEAKSTEGSALFQLYQAFADRPQAEAMRQAFADGIAWGEAKAALFGLIDSQVAPMREKYEALMARPIEIEAALREAVGLRDLSKGVQVAVATPERAEPAVASFKQYREGGKFYFKLVDGGGRLLMASHGSDSARDVGQLIARLRASGGDGVKHVPGIGLQLGEEAFGEIAGAVSLDDIRNALAGLAAAESAS